MRGEISVNQPVHVVLLGCSSGYEYPYKSKGILPLSRELPPKEFKKNSSILITPRPNFWRCDSTVLVSQHRSASLDTIPHLWASPVWGRPGPSRNCQGPGGGKRGLPRGGGPDLTHLGKGLAAAETVNLHLVEAGDLHGGAEEATIPVPVRNPLPAEQASLIHLRKPPRAPEQLEARAPGTAPAPGDYALPGASGGRNKMADPEVTELRERSR